MAPHMPDRILLLLSEESLRYGRVAITTFASIYQPLFRLACNDRSHAKLWHTLDIIKRKIVTIFDLPGHMNLKIAALKAFQKIILVQTRPGDPKGASTSKLSNDAHIGQIPPDHPFLKVAALETEANERLTQVVTVIFTSSNPDLVMPAMNSLATLAKFRQSLHPIVFEALISWTPTAMSSISFTSIRSVEKTLRLLFHHFHPSRNSWAGPYASQIIEAVDTQKLRMDSAAREEEEKREKEATVKRERLGEEINGTTAQKRKRVRFAAEEEEETKLQQANEAVSPEASIPTASTSATGAAPPGTSMDIAQGRRSATAFQQSSTAPGEENPLAAFDVTTLPLNLIIELILANLQALTEEDLQRAIARTRTNLDQAEQTPVLKPPAPPPLHPGPPPSFPPRDVVMPKEELMEIADGTAEVDADGNTLPLDPLKLDVGDEELLEEVERNIEEESDISSALTTFTLKPPGKLEMEECKTLVRDSVNRICESGVKMNTISKGNTTQAQLWSMLVTRLASRGLNVEDADQSNQASNPVRQLMLDFVVGNFAERIEFAVQWMGEEYYTQAQRKKEQGNSPPSIYEEWLLKMVTSLGASLDGKDRTMMDLFSRLPSIPDSVIDTLEALCLDKAKIRIGFGMLRELAIQREPTRDKIGSILLNLTRNEEKTIRSAAIITVRNWVRSEGKGVSEAGIKLEEKVLSAAREGLQRLTVRSNAAPRSNGDASPAVKIELKEETGTEANGDNVSPSALDDPLAEVTEMSDVVRLVELPFALCVRVSSMLDEIFNTFPSMSPLIQEAIKRAIKPLIQTLGPNNKKLLTLIRTHPAGSESLAVCVFMVMTEKQKSKKVVDLVKEMAEEKNDIDPKFLIPILPDLVKSEIIKYLPRVVTILSSEKSEDRAIIKAVFASIVTMPAQGFGSISSNLPRVRSSELLSPVELMTLLHHSEREIGLKMTMEAIRICFGMTDIFRSEVLGAVLNLILEEPDLPLLFMRTAIMAVRTYKSLSSYISTIFLSRLITKKVWQQPLLWDGFVICANQTAPASFGALIQLPRDQLRDVITRQPDLRTGLREYLVKKAGGHKVRLKNFLELLGETPDDLLSSNGAINGPNSINDNPSTPSDLHATDSRQSTPQPVITDS